MSHQKYYDYLQSLGHVLKLDENGNIDAFWHDFENHNGPSCINCGASWCHHCEEDAKPCEKEVNAPPDVYDIVVDTGDGIYHTAEVVHFQQKGSKRMIQVRLGDPQADDVRKDAERWRYLKDKYAMVNFDIYDAEMGETKVTGIIFEMPSGIRYSADINATIDQAIDLARE